MRLTFQNNLKVKVTKYRSNKRTLTAEISMSKIQMMMYFKFSNRCKILFDHPSLSLNVVNTEFMCKIGKKYRCVSRAVCA